MLLARELGETLNPGAKGVEVTLRGAARAHVANSEAALAAISKLYIRERESWISGESNEVENVSETHYSVKMLRFG